jgi:hypothetical protein
VDQTDQRTHRTKWCISVAFPCAALPARGSGAQNSSEFYAHTCAEGGDAIRPRADVYRHRVMMRLARQGGGAYRSTDAEHPGPTARARQSVGDMENAPPRRWDPRTSPAHGTAPTS